MTESAASGAGIALPESPVASARRLIAPLALAQFICSFAGSNMNVMINDISQDLNTTVKGVQTAITLFLLIMAILMIPCSKLTDRWGRKRCFLIGLALYGVGALLSAISPNLGVLILGNSVLEGVGTALLIPPVYILATLWFTDLTWRAWAFGVISGLGGIGAAAGPLIGGVITTAISWRAAFVFQAVDRRRDRPAQPAARGPAAGRPGAALRRPRRHPVGRRAVLPRARHPRRPAPTTPSSVLLVVVGAAFLARLLPLDPRARAGGQGAAALDGALPEPDLEPRARDPERAVALLMGTSFTVSVYLQTVRGYSAIKTGVVFTAATVGLLVSSLAAERLATRRTQKHADHRGLRGHDRRDRLLIALVGRRRARGRSSRACSSSASVSADAHAVGQRRAVRFPRRSRARSPASRAASRTSARRCGTAIAGTILISVVTHGNRAYGWAMASLAVFGLIGLVAALGLPGRLGTRRTDATAPAV